MNLSQRWRRPLLTLHVVAAVSLIGTDLVLVALGISGVRGADPRTVYPAAYLVEAWLVAPLVVVALGTGVLQAVLLPWGLVRYWWVTIKLTTTAVFTVLVVFALIPRLAASADAAMAAETFTAAARLPLALVPSLAVAVLVLNVVLGIYKPGWRIQRVSRRELLR
ncbi:MAG: hypothetical protein GEV03_19025 [Streptosporangiales bacterium]|nr:hypothetical protein [Streptosporangiales bacterium]